MQPSLWARARKAFRGAFVAMIGAFIVGLKTEIPQTRDGWIMFVMGIIGIGVTAWFTIYYAENAREYTRVNAPKERGNINGLD